MSDRAKKEPAYGPPLMRRLAVGSFLLLILLLGTLVIAAGPAEAHAFLLRADPTQNERTDDPPSRFVLWFSEELEPRHSTVRVLDSDDKDHVIALHIEDARIDVGVEPLDEGLYTVRWEVLSTRDGHPTSGGYLVAVGMDIPEEAELLGTDDVTDIRFWETLARAFGYAGASLAAGIPVYLLYRFRFVPLKGWLHQPLSQNQSREIFLMLLAGWSGIISALAAISMILGLAVRINVGPIDAVTSTQSGQLLAVRTALLFAAAAFAFQAARAGRRIPWIGASLLVALAALLVTSLGAHAASAGDGVHGANIAMDFIHQASAAAWISGIIALLFTLPRAQDARTAGILVRDFSPFALGAVVILIATGVYSSLLHLDNPFSPGSPTTGWEWALLVKILLIIPLIILGAYNRYILQPRLLDAKDPSVPRIKRSVKAEVVLMMIVLVATGALTHATPPAQVDEFTGPLPGQIAEHETEDGDLFRITVQPQPVTVGIQNITVHLTPADEIPERLQVFFEIHGPDGGEDSRQPQQIEGEHRWYVRDTIFTQTGGYHIDVTVQGRGYFETFEFIVIVE